MLALLGGLAGGVLVAKHVPFPFLGAEDQLSDAAAAARQAAFTAAGPLTLEEVPAAEQAAAIQQMQLDPQPRAELQKAVETKQLRLVRLSLWDDDAEDGDVVRITAGGFSQDVFLRHAAVTLVIPLSDPAQLGVTGVHDGGGGITVAIRANGQQVPLPRMREGQSIPIGVR